MNSRQPGIQKKSEVSLGDLVKGWGDGSVTKGTYRLG